MYNGLLMHSLQENHSNFYLFILFLDEN